MGRVERGMGTLVLAGTRLRQLGWKIRRPVTMGVRAIIFRGDELLLVRGHAQRRWHIPGGGVERNELLSETAVREVREETGWIVQVDHLLGMYTNFSEGKSDHIAIFVCTAVRQGPFRFNIEIAEARFFPRTELPPCHGSVHRRLDDLDSGQVGIYGRW